MNTIHLLLACILAFTDAPLDREVIAPPGANPALPFSPAIASGQFVYLAGTIPARGEPGAAEASIEVQTRQTFERMGKTLAAAGLDFSDVVCSNVYLTESRHFQAMNSVYREFFSDLPPVRATVETDLAVDGVGIEITFVAARKGVKRQGIMPPRWKSPTSPYSWGVMAGDTLFISGMVSRDPTEMKLVTGGIQTQTRQVLDNIGAVLTTAGLGYEDVVSSRVFLVDSRDFQAMNEVYRTYFQKDPPARATVRTRLMNPALLVEIQCVAVKGEGRRVVAPAGSRPGRPFSPAIQAGGRLFLSGMVGRGPSGFAPGDVATQTRVTLDRLQATLAVADLDPSHVLDATVFLTDVRHFGAVNEIYRSLFPEAPPARTTVGAGLMSPDALVEIMMTAVAP